MLQPERREELTTCLQIVTNGLIRMAEDAGRKYYTKNQLLRECYNLMNEVLRTEEDWASEGAYIKDGSQGWLFWNAGEIEERFTLEQVRFTEMID